MSEETTLEAYADKQELIDNIDEIFETTVKDLLVEQDAVHVVLTGGTVGIALLENIDPGHVLDWSRIHLWWGDERFVPAGHADRNEGQATTALIHSLPIPAENVHRMLRQTLVSVWTKRWTPTTTNWQSTGLNSPNSTSRSSVWDLMHILPVCSQASKALTWMIVP